MDYGAPTRNSTSVHAGWTQQHRGRMSLRQEDSTENGREKRFNVAVKEKQRKRLTSV